MWYPKHLREVLFDNKLTFDNHIYNLYAKPSRKLNVPYRLLSLRTNKMRQIMKANISSQFSCCSLLWMNYSRTLNNKINRIHKRSFWVVYDDRKTTFKQLLDKDRTVSIHTRNLQILVTEMFQLKFRELSSILHEVFQIDNSNNYNFRKIGDLNLVIFKTCIMETKTISVSGLKLWIILPDEYKNLTTLKEFKAKVTLKVLIFMRTNFRAFAH